MESVQYFRDYDAYFFRDSKILALIMMKTNTWSFVA